MPKIFSSEHVYSYKNYTFGYALYCQRLNKETIDPIYAAGFLPYSGDYKSEVKDLYYMARSARVKLSAFSPTSENRRIKNKFKEYNLRSEEYAASDFLKDEKMIDFCLQYFETRHGANIISKERFKRWLNYSPEVKIIEYTDDDTPRAYIIEIHGENFLHYWYSFYDLSLVYKSFGMWLMLDRVEAAKKKGLEYCYLGTVYGEKALYKTNIPSLEYWNGRDWITNSKKLKELARSDEERVVVQADEFKTNNEA